jgi:type VI secretion system secreted protein Hcp
MKDIYLKFNGPNIKGESQDSEHADWIEIQSWSHNIAQPRSATSSTAGGQTAERVFHDEHHFTKDLDIVTPLLYQHASAGTTFEEVTIDFLRADGEKRVKYLEVKLKNVLIGTVASAVSGEGLPVDSFSLKYSAISWVYTKQKIGGAPGGNSQGSWNLAKNTTNYNA